MGRMGRHDPEAWGKRRYLSALLRCPARRKKGEDVKSAIVPIKLKKGRPSSLLKLLGPPPGRGGEGDLIEPCSTTSEKNELSPP